MLDYEARRDQAGFVVDSQSVKPPSVQDGIPRFDVRAKPMEQSACDLRSSYGPFLKMSQGYVYDARPPQPSEATPKGHSRSLAPPRIGYNASALFGVLHHRTTWPSQPENSSHLASPPFASAMEHRQYIEAEILTQFSDVASQLQNNVRDVLENATSACPSVPFRWLRPNPNDPFPLPAGQFDLATQEVATEAQRHLQNHGILVQRVGSRIELGLNLGYTSQHLESFSNRFIKSWIAFSEGPGLDTAGEDGSHVPFTPPTSLDENYKFHELLLRQKMSGCHDQDDRAPFSVEGWFREQAEGRYSELRLKRIGRQIYRDYRTRILEMQTRIYEPARQTPPEEFDSLFESDRAIGIAVLDGEHIVAMAFAGPLNSFLNERGVPQDPYRNDADVFYSVDLTVVPEFQRGLGKVVKRAVILQALSEGVSAIHGRNRDRLARGMWAINLSLGSYQLRRLENDYPDDGPFRDCIYYRCPLWMETSSIGSTWQLPDDWDLSLPRLINGV